MRMPDEKCNDCAEYGSEFCDECLKEKEMREKHPNCGTPDCCGECETAKNTEVTSWMKAQKMNEEMTTAADAGIPHTTKDMGPKFKAHTVIDKRRKKNKTPVLLKRFRRFIEDNA